MDYQAEIRKEGQQGADNIIHCRGYRYSDRSDQDSGKGKPSLFQ
jgi:hypothetical protein